MSELAQLFKDGYEIDRKMFSEHRTNAQLFNGDHYGDKVEEFDRTVKQQKYDKDALRITENHIRRIINMRASALKALVPDVTVRPKNFDEFGDQKRAEIHRAVLEDWKKQSCFKEEEIRMIKEWMVYGEIAVKLSWDDGAGRKLDPLFVAEVDKDFDDVDKNSVQGVEIVIDADDVKFKKIQRFEGRVEAEIINPYDLIRDPCAESLKDSDWYCVKKLVDPAELKRHFDKDDERYAAVSETSNNSYNTFRTDGKYSRTDKKTLIRKFFFKPSFRYPDGYFFVVAGSGVPVKLWEGKIPGGGDCFPIEVLGYDEIAGSPRHVSLIRDLRPNQLQVNLFKSKSIESALKTGMDSVYITKGSKLSKPIKDGSGIIQREFTGQTPTIIPGRVGEQFAAPISDNISQMYTKANVQEAFEQQNKQVDAHTALYQSAKQKAVYSDYVCKYENFLKNVYYKVLKMTKEFIDEEAVIMIAGKDEHINIPEYKTSDDLGWEICMEGQSEDAESKLGRSLDLQKILQYGSNFEGPQLAALIKTMPYLNNDQIIETLPGYRDYQNAMNDICRLDRGDESVLQVRRYENHDIMLQILTARTKKPDFDILPDFSKQLYAEKIQIHEQVKAEQIQAQRTLESDFIPTGGALLKIEGLVENAGTTQRGTPKVVAVRLPQESIQWLRDRLKNQGLQLEVLEQQQEQVRAEIAQQVVQADQIQQQQSLQDQALAEDQQLAQILELTQT